MIKLCHSIPVKSVENDKVAGSCISEPLYEDRQQIQETAVEDQAATTDGGEDTVSDIGNKVEAEAASDIAVDKDAMETDIKVSGDTQNVPEETVESESTQAVSVSEPAGETVDSENDSKKVEEEEKKTEDIADADTSSAAKDSSSVEGDDQKKRFVVFCLLETKMVISVALAPLY